MDKNEKIILAEEIRKGNISSLEKVFRLYNGRLFSFVYKIVRSRETAQDITQDVFVKFWVNRESINPGMSVIGLLYMMAKNAALDFLRSKYHSLLPLVADIVEESEDVESRVKSLLDRPDIGYKVEESISNLPSQQQKVFVMSKIAHMSNKDIADSLGLSIRTVEKHLELAKKNLRNNLS
mgnify:CR=1 FL=1